MLNSILLLISITMMYSTPLVFGALGGMISEKSGVTNIGIEGIMTVGAAAGVCVAYFTKNPWLGFLAAGAVGGLIALLHAVASITFKADQTVSGIAINLVGAGAALFMARLVFGVTNTPSVPKKLPKIFGSGADMGAISKLNFEATTIIALIFTLILWFVLNKTKWGLRISAVGEHPKAADTLGINIYKIRYICVVVSGILGGFGGASMTLSIISNFTPTAISGHGFIALAAVIFGKWKPMGVYGACLLFGFSQALAIQLSGGKFAVPSQILAMLPYALTILVLIFFVGHTVAPKASGVPYEKGQR